MGAMTTAKPLRRVLVLADVPNWAWGRKAREYKTHLSGDWDITIAYHDRIPDFRAFDLVHLFEVNQLRALPVTWQRESAVVAGLTANVWRTWGTEQMRAWAAQCDALHANSVLLEKDLKTLTHERGLAQQKHVFYTPNGVDVDFWNRDEVLNARNERVTACHVGKPNPRKGADLIIEACKRIEMPLLLCQRTSKIALDGPAIRTLYARSHLQITASDMDGTPNPMLEAAAMSNALLSTSIGNMPELIEQGCEGYIYDRGLHDPGNTESWIVEQTPAQRELFIETLCERLRWFQRHPGDAIAMGHMARRTVVERWTWQHACRYIHRMWDTVLSWRGIR